MKDYRISVLMGIYNCAPTLQEALDSLYVQTYQGFKIILCDDGSKDDTLKIAEENAKKHENVIVIKNEHNMGLNYTLNHCLEYADTEFCARMDGDDTCHPTRFEKEIKFLDEHPEYAIVSTTMHHFDEMGIFRTGMASGEPKPSDYPKGVPFNHAPCMIRTSAYKTVGGYSVSGKLLRQEDYHLWLKMYEKGFRGYMLNEPLYNMRDDRNAYARRNWISRRNEAYVKYLACKMLNLPFWYYMYCLKPIILYIMPQWLYKRLHNR
ncbi:MAG: glycosyltransferase [Sodaliphilus sp.]|nr:glycosyltransferase [Sodaliphilus sp.]